MTAAARVLVVEDEAIVAMAIQRCLTQSGYELCGLAATGEAAVECALREKPDVVLMDVGLPGRIDGIDAARQILAEHDPTIIFISGYTGDADSMARIGELTSQAVLEKPVMMAELVTAIRTALEDC